MVPRHAKNSLGSIRGNPISDLRDHEDCDIQIVNLTRINETAGAPVLDGMARRYQPLNPCQQRLCRHDRGADRQGNGQGSEETKPHEADGAPGSFQRG
jgi:hypothetical protein